jgi:hypothetical protein
VHNKLWSRKVVEFGFGVHTVSFYYGNLNGCHIQKRTTFHSVESFLPMAPCDKLQVVENVNNNKRSKCGISKTQKSVDASFVAWKLWLFQKFHCEKKSCFVHIFKSPTFVHLETENANRTSRKGKLLSKDTGLKNPNRYFKKSKKKPSF